MYCKNEHKLIFQSPYLVVGTAWERCLFLSQFWSRVLNSFISASLNCSSECNDCNWKRSSGQFYCYHFTPGATAENWVTLRAPDLLTVNSRPPFLRTSVQLTLSENQVPAVQARSLWVSGWDRASATESMAPVRLQLQSHMDKSSHCPLQGLRHDCNRNSNLIRATKHVLSLFPTLKYTPTAMFSGWLEESNK